MLSSLPIPQLQGGWTLCLPILLTKGRSLLFSECLLHTANSAVLLLRVQCTGREPHIPTSKTWLACRRPQEDQRVFWVFLIPATLPSCVTLSPGLLINPCPSCRTRGSQWSKGQTQLRTAQVLNPRWTAAHQRGWSLVLIEQNILQHSSQIQFPDFLHLSPPRGY